VVLTIVGLAALVKNRVILTRYALAKDPLMAFAPKRCAVRKKNVGYHFMIVWTVGNQLLLRLSAWLKGAIKLHAA
jgi:hypothetical protein